jgi:hypothetical protein
MEWMKKCESVDETNGQRHRRRYEAAGRDNQPDEEYVLGHRTSVAKSCAGVQAEALIAHKRFL